MYRYTIFIHARIYKAFLIQIKYLIQTSGGTQVHRNTIRNIKLYIQFESFLIITTDRHYYSISHFEQFNSKNVLNLLKLNLLSTKCIHYALTLKAI